MTTYTTDPVARREIEKRILNLHHDGAERIAVRAVLEAVREDLQLPVNNNEQTAITDALIAKHPTLAPKIRTRARGNRGLNRQKQGAQLAKLLKTGAVIEYVVLQHKGKSVRVTARQLALLAA